MAIPKIDFVFHRFAELLEDRFSKRRMTTEDSVRYTLFYCLTKDWKVNPSDIVLEYPHTCISGAEVDTYVMPRNGRPPVAFEFKFDRKIPSGKNLPRPQKAGKIFADIFRLALFKTENDVQLFFVYVTDDEMATYLQNPSNQLADFFNMLPGEHFVLNEQYIGKHSPTLVKAAGGNVIDCEVGCELNIKCNSSFWLRIYTIKPRAPREMPPSSSLKF